MASQPGEERLITVFADIHSYFSAPVPRPHSDRFDKASYLYLHGSTSGNGARLEVANHVGKPEQDAFTGSLNTATIRQSHKQPTLCTVTVDGYHGIPSSQRPEYHWKLPTADIRSPRNLPTPLHTVDIYFWTSQDADTFISAVRRLLHPDQLELVEFPPAPRSQESVASPVVQQLENMAIRDPAYRNDPNRASRTDSLTQSHKSSSVHPADTESPKPVEPASFQPLAYNPAAPAAPEPIAHREKTPPPPDAESGTGLTAAASADHGHAVSSQSSLSRPPYGLTSSSSGYIGGPPVQPGMAAVPPPPSQPSHSAYSAASPPGQTHSFAPPPSQSPHTSVSPSQQQLVRQDTSSSQHHDVGFGQPSPGAEILGNTYGTGYHQPLQHVQPQYPDYLSSGHQAQAPVGGYSNFQYQQQEQQQPSQTSTYDVHSQVYRPTEEEYAKMNKNRTSSTGQAATPYQPGRLEQGAGKLDKGVNRLFKKIEKRIG